MTIPVPASVKTFLKRPVPVTALQWTGEDARADELWEWTARPAKAVPNAVATQFMVLGEDDAYEVFRDLDEDGEVVADSKVGQLQEKGYTAVVYDMTHDAWLGAHTGDWIIKGLQGEFYPCSPDDFDRIYADENIDERIRSILYRHLIYLDTDTEPRVLPQVKAEVLAAKLTEELFKAPVDA